MRAGELGVKDGQAKDEEEEEEEAAEERGAERQSWLQLDRREDAMGLRNEAGARVEMESR